MFQVVFKETVFLCAVYVWEFNEELIVQLPPDLCFLYLLLPRLKGVTLCSESYSFFFFFLKNA